MQKYVDIFGKNIYVLFIRDKRICNEKLFPVITQERKQKAFYYRGRLNAFLKTFSMQNKWSQAPCCFDNSPRIEKQITQLLSDRLQ